MHENERRVMMTRSHFNVLMVKVLSFIVYVKTKHFNFTLQILKQSSFKYVFSIYFRMLSLKVKQKFNFLSFTLIYNL